MPPRQATDRELGNDRGGGAGVRPWQPRPRGDRGIRDRRRGSARAPRTAGFRDRLSRIRPADHSTGAPGFYGGRGPAGPRRPRRTLAVRGMLFAESHVKNDLPWEMNSFMAANPGIEVRLGRDLAIDPKLLTAAAERIAAAVPGERADAVLVVVGRGTNDPDANS